MTILERTCTSPRIVKSDSRGQLWKLLSGAEQHTPAEFGEIYPTNATCRSCGEPLREIFADLGVSPLSNGYLMPGKLHAMEPCYPLCAYVCTSCWLVQLEEYESPDRIFSSEYAYFSSYSDSWLAHSKRYSDEMVKRFGFNKRSSIVEVASNDGYLLQYFVEKGIPVLGIEPAANVAEVAVKKGVPTVVKFFGEASARELRK